MGVIAKAQEAGIGGKLLHWLLDYLTDRKAKVAVGGYSSDPHTIGAECPKVAFLGQHYSCSTSVILTSASVLIRSYLLLLMTPPSIVLHIVSPFASRPLPSNGHLTAYTNGDSAGESVSNHPRPSV